MRSDVSYSQNRRETPRVRVPFPVTYSFQDPTKKDGHMIVGKGEVVDVSSSGVCLEFHTPAVLLHGAAMNLALELPTNAPPIRANGWVRWSLESEGGTRIGILLAVTKEKEKFQHFIYGSMA